MKTCLCAPPWRFGEEIEEGCDHGVDEDFVEEPSFEHVPAEFGSDNTWMQGADLDQILFTILFQELGKMTSEVDVRKL